MPEAAARQRRWALLLLWVLPALWAVNYIVARRAPGVIGPHLLALGRWAIAAGVLLALSWGELCGQRAHLRAAWWQYFVLGALGMLVCGAWVYQGARSTVALNISLIYAASPVLIGLGAARWLGERQSLRQRIGVALALAGVLHVIARGQWLALGSVQFVPGDWWMVGATVAWAAYALLQKIWPSPLGATARLAAMCSAGVLTLVPFALWELSKPGLTVWGAQAAELVLVAALLPGLAAYWIYGWAQKILGASRVAVALYLGPLYAAVVAWGLLGEVPGWHHAVGGALILLGVFMASAPAAAPKPGSPRPTAR